MRDEDYPNNIIVEKPVFPYLIQEENSTPTAYVTISLPDRNFDVEERTLFYVAGASILKQDRGSGGTDYHVRVDHSFARDFEYDGSTIADFELSNMELVSAWDNTLNYVGWLTTVRFYPENHEYSNDILSNPFENAVDKGYEGNNEYPYQPPQVSFDKILTLPIQVQVSLSYNRHDVTEKLAEAIEQHQVAAVKRAEEKAALIEKKRIDREKRRAEEEEWLKTDEGKEYAAERKFFNLLKVAAQRGDAPNEKIYDSIELAAHEDFKTFSEEEISFLKLAKVNRNWTISKNDPMRQFYSDTFDALLEEGNNGE
jgi:hypothetical protein